ncbi:magnesium/cobalt transporter CorA [Rhodopirellula sp. MGV]|uniref:magnesium/cobalt transporter CorA n=1 Tax=Rhodopirellula sp. MGV TaxID=2023130 RepID=UPI000B96E000|nr:magnesium/cobalt transporter CorA [Rhodopirellula sp. MGV]OYP28519.1 magnesium and cobalt transport protein CorA [Rhodopirellula sp. MGV]PNY38904.1 magnesium and cobalt transport protein CorA [Rhodopirellula baltica]
MFKKRHTEVGARPGTLVISDEAPKPSVYMIHYRREGQATEKLVASTDELEAAFHDGHVTWVDVQGFGDHALMKSIGDIFNLHPLLLEDVVNLPQRAKAEHYDEQLLLIVKMVAAESASVIELEQISIVIGETYVLTFQEYPGDVLDPVRKRIRAEKTTIRNHGADYLAYAIADTIVDAYYPVLETIGDRIEDLEDDVVINPTPELLRELNRLKNRLVNLRRAVWPQREAIHSLIRDGSRFFSDEVRLYLRDTHDHCVQTSEVIEMYREMVASLLNTYLTSIANRTNDVMKVLTIVATIFIPLTFMSGIYGMNFDHMPELHTRWGYPIIWAAMILTAGSMVVFFRRRGWLGGGDAADDE